MTALLYLLVGHYLGDFALQNDFVAKGKNPFLNGVNPDLGSKRSTIWIHVMVAHCAIQAGTVLLATGSTLLFMFELVAHFITDYSKCRGYLSFAQDQAIHIACRLVWWGLFMGSLA